MPEKKRYVEPDEILDTEPIAIDPSSGQPIDLRIELKRHAETDASLMPTLADIMPWAMGTIILWIVYTGIVSLKEYVSSKSEIERTVVIHGDAIKSSLTSIKEKMTASTISTALEMPPAASEEANSSIDAPRERRPSRIALFIESIKASFRKIFGKSQPQKRGAEARPMRRTTSRGTKNPKQSVSNAEQAAPKKPSYGISRF